MPSLLEQFPPSLSLLAFSLEPYTMVSFHCTMHKPRFLGMVMFYLHFSYLVGPYPWNVANVCFTFPLYMITLCMMYIYLYMLVCAWSCTLYDGLLWLLTLSSHEYSWPCSVSMHLRHLLLVHIHTILCAWIDHHSVIVSLHVTWVTLVSPYMWHVSICLML